MAFAFITHRMLYLSMNKTKSCTKCHIVKPLDEFYKSGDRYEAECKVCRRQRSSKYYKKNWERERARRKTDRAQNPEKYRKYELLRAYQLTPEKYDTLLFIQNNKCPGCLREFSRTVIPFIDHDHNCCPDKRGTCGKCVRGLLCQLCNASLGYARDSAEVLQNLAAYIENVRKI